MRAFVLPAFGDTVTLTELDTPNPMAGEVRVRVHATSVNGFDLAVAAGMLEGVLEHRFPVVLGKDFAGVIDAVGDGVDGYSVGDRVFGVVTKSFLGNGAFAEYVTVPVSVGLARIPDGLSFTDAAALGLAGTAAVDAVTAAQIVEGDTVLIAGATGGVGTLAVQLASLKGAKVIATARTPEEVAQVRSLGATDTVDYTGDIAAQVRELAADGVDVALHFAGDPTALSSVVATGGRLVSTLLQSPDQLPLEDVSVVPVYANPTPDTLVSLASHLVDGRARLVIDRSYRLDDVADAFAAFSNGTVGKIVVTIAA